MKGIKFHLIITLISVLIISCGSGPTPTPEPRPEPRPETRQESEPIVQVPEPVVTPEVREEPRNETTETTAPVVITEEYYVSIRSEVRQFIQRLNQIITVGDYEAWRTALSPDLFAEISSEENLRRISEQPIMTSRRIVLRNAQDYFTHVVRPARANITDEIDNIDIEFVTLTRVKAFTVTTTRAGEEQQVRLYDLEKIGNLWTIIN